MPSELQSSYSSQKDFFFLQQLYACKSVEGKVTPSQIHTVGYFLFVFEKGVKKLDRRRKSWVHRARVWMFMFVSIPRKTELCRHKRKLRMGRVTQQSIWFSWWDFTYLYLKLSHPLHPQSVFRWNPEISHHSLCKILFTFQSIQGICSDFHSEHNVEVTKKKKKNQPTLFCCALTGTQKHQFLVVFF